MYFPFEGAKICEENLERIAEAKIPSNSSKFSAADQTVCLRVVIS